MILDVEARTASRLAHLKAAGDPHKSNANAPTLCGLPDPGIYFYATVASLEALAKMKAEVENSYPLCATCEAHARYLYDPLTPSEDRRVAAASEFGVFPEMNDIANRIVQAARARGFASFWPAFPSATAQAENTYSGAASWLERAPADCERCKTGEAHEHPEQVSDESR